MSVRSTVSQAREALPFDCSRRLCGKMQVTQENSKAAIDYYNTLSDRELSAQARLARLYRQINAVGKNETPRGIFRKRKARLQKNEKFSELQLEVVKAQAEIYESRRKKNELEPFLNDMGLTPVPKNNMNNAKDSPLDRTEPFGRILETKRGFEKIQQEYEKEKSEILSRRAPESEYLREKEQLRRQKALFNLRYNTHLLLRNTIRRAGGTQPGYNKAQITSSERSEPTEDKKTEGTEHLTKATDRKSKHRAKTVPYHLRTETSTAHPSSVSTDKKKRASLDVQVQSLVQKYSVFFTNMGSFQKEASFRAYRQAAEYVGQNSHLKAEIEKVASLKKEAIEDACCSGQTKDLLNLMRHYLTLDEIAGEQDNNTGGIGIEKHCSPDKNTAVTPPEDLKAFMAYRNDNPLKSYNSIANSSYFPWIRKGEDVKETIKKAVESGLQLKRYDNNIAPDAMKEEMVVRYCTDYTASLEHIAKDISEKYKVNVSSATIRKYARKKLGSRLTRVGRKAERALCNFRNLGNSYHRG